MANVINKKTGVYLKSVHTPNYPEADWIINPTPEQIKEYTPIVVSKTSIEILTDKVIAQKTRELQIAEEETELNRLKEEAIVLLKEEEVLDVEGVFIVQPIEDTVLDGPITTK